MERNKRLKFNLVLVESEYGEIAAQYNYKSYGSVNIAMKMRDHMRAIINNCGFINIPEMKGCSFNSVSVEVEYSDDQ